MNRQAGLNDLIRWAFEAQDAFDNWDAGITWDSLRRKRHCTLAEVVKELDEANAKLVEYVMAHGETLLRELNAR